jgi:hypothetical protein
MRSPPLVLALTAWNHYSAGDPRFFRSHHPANARKYICRPPLRGSRAPQNHRSVRSAAFCRQGTLVSPGPRFSLGSFLVSKPLGSASICMNSPTSRTPSMMIRRIQPPKRSIGSSNPKQKGGSGSTNISGKKLRDCKPQDVQFPIHRRSIEARPFVSGIGNVDDLEIVEFLIKNISRTVRGATALPILA